MIGATIILGLAAFGNCGLVVTADRASCSSPLECVELSRSMPVAHRAIILVEACERWPHDLPLHLYASRALLADQRYGDAISLLEDVENSAIQQAPPQAQEALAVLKARALLWLGRASDARSLVRAYAISSLQRGELSAALQLHIHALIDLSEARAARPVLDAVSAWPLGKIQRALIEVEKARLALASGAGDEALAALSRSLAAQPTEEARVFRALVYVWVGDFSAARQEAKGVPTEELNDGLAAIPGLLVRLVEDGPIKRVALRRQIEEYPLEQAGYFIAAAAFWSREEVEEACRLLRAGREATRSTTLLYPPWLACCK